MDAYWVPGVNYLRTYGRWAFLELSDANTMNAEFSAAIERYVKEAAEYLLEYKRTQAEATQRYAPHLGPFSSSLDLGLVNLCKPGQQLWYCATLADKKFISQALNSGVDR